MRDIAVLTPLLQVLDVRAALRLSATCTELRLLLRPAILDWIGRLKCPCRWRRARAGSARVGDPSTSAPRVAFAHATPRLAGAQLLYVPVLPTPEQVIRHLQTDLCRECLAPTQSWARASSGAWVLVCRACGRDEEGYSALVDRAEARNLLRGRVSSVDAALRALPIARRGGNRAHLFWRHAVRATAGLS